MIPKLGAKVTKKALNLQLSLLHEFMQFGFRTVARQNFYINLIKKRGFEKMRKYKVSKFIAEEYGDDPICNQTVINWIRRGKLLGVKEGGMWFVLIPDTPAANDVSYLVDLLEASK